MKKLLLITSFLALFSCGHHDQRIKFNPHFDQTRDNVGKGVGIDLVIVDDRRDDILGEKIFSKNETIKIISDENLAESLQKKVGELLLQKGFKKGWNKTLQIEISHLTYKAKREFFVGRSDAQMSVRVVVSDNKNQGSFSKSFDSSFASYHFIAPLQSTDELTINNMIKDIINSIFHDREILEKLTK